MMKIIKEISEICSINIYRVEADLYDTLMDFIRNCFKEKKELGQLLHRKAMDYFKERGPVLARKKR